MTPPGPSGTQHTPCGCLDRVTLSEDPPTASIGAAASRGVLGRGSLYTLGTAAPVLANAAVTPAVTRLLGVDAYGVVSIGIVVMQIGMMVSGLGMSSVITRQGLLGRSGQDGARSLMVRAVTITSLLVGSVVLLSPLWSQALATDLRRAVVIALLTAACYVAVEDSQAMLRVLDRPLPFVGLSLISTLGGPLLGLTLVARHATPERYLLGMLGGYAVAALVGLTVTLRSGPHHHEGGDTRTALRMGLPMLPHMVAIFAANGGLLVVAGALFDRAQVARLSVAMLLGMAPGVVTAAMNNSWGPTVYRAAQSERAEVLEHTAVDVAYLAATMASGVSLLSPWLLRLAAGADFQPAQLAPQVGIVAFGTILSVGYLGNVHLVFASGRTFGLSITTPTALAVGLASAAALSQLDVRLLAVGFPVTYAGMFLGAGWLAHRVSGVHWHMRVLVPPIVLGGTMCALGALLPTSGGISLARIVCVIALGAFALKRVHLVIRR